MNDEPITAAQRESLRYYLATKNRDITPWFVLRFYRYRITRSGCFFLLFALATKVLAPHDISVSIQTAMLMTIATLFIGLLAMTLRTSFASVEHWRLLRRVLDWDRVRKLHGNGSQGGG